MRPLVNVDLERAVLAVILMDPATNDHLLARLKASHFTNELHRAVFSAMVWAKAAGAPIDTTIIASITSVAAPPDFLNVLVNAVASPRNAEGYVDRLIELAGLRALRGIDLTSIVEDASTLSDAVSETLMQVNAIDAGTVRGQLPGLDDLVRDSFEALTRRFERTEPAGLPTGIRVLDDMMLGMVRGGFYVAAGPTGSGKTVLAGAIWSHAVLEANLRALFVSLEMSQRSMTDRLACARARVPTELFRDGRALEPHHWKRLQAAYSALSAASTRGSSILHRSMTIAELYTVAKTAHVTSPIDLLLVDYLQLLRGTGRRKDNREQEVAEVARGLKNLALDLNCVVIGVSQVNRDVDKRPDRRPKLSDLRESGEIEQAADGVLMLHRPEDDDGDRGEETELHLRKHRHGPPGWVRLRFIGEQYRFEEY